MIMSASIPSLNQWHRSVRANVRWPTMFGVAILVLWAGGFGVWAGIAPLDGAVVAPGTFVATGQNKQIQHFEGGIIAQMLVREGDTVDSGQPLVRLDETAARAKLRRLVLRRYRLLVMQARLDAEIGGREAFLMPPALESDRSDPEVDVIFERQQNEMRTRRAKRNAEEQVLRKEIAGLGESISGYQAQVTSIKQRLALFAEELKDKSDLMQRQLIRKTEVLAVQRSEAGLSGELGEIMGRIADSHERVARAEQQITHVKSTAVQKAVEELRDTETELDDVQEQIRAAQDVLQRTEVRSPVHGVIVKLHQHTQGGVVAPGAVILEILPVNDALLIEARVAPAEIAHVTSGQDALVRLSALNQRLTPMIKAKVVYLSADAIAEQSVQQKDQRSAGRDSFVVRVALEDTDVREKLATFRPTPGMPAEVFIKTGERTFFEYMLRPVLDSFNRAFREQ
jgi:HlyD family type I secretion membrane fusion protein